MFIDHDNDDDNVKMMMMMMVMIVMMTCYELLVYSEADRGAYERVRVNKVHRPVDRVDDPRWG